MHTNWMDWELTSTDFRTAIKVLGSSNTLPWRRFVFRLKWSITSSAVYAVILVGGQKIAVCEGLKYRSWTSLPGDTESAVLRETLETLASAEAHSSNESGFARAMKLTSKQSSARWTCSQVQLNASVCSVVCSTFHGNTIFEHSMYYWTWLCLLVSFCWLY